MENAANGLERIDTAYNNLKHRLENLQTLRIKKIFGKTKSTYKNEFNNAMDDDFNTANGIAAIFELVTLTNGYLLEENTESMSLSISSQHSMSS